MGFIGLGNMGAPMALNLAKVGHMVTGFDIAAPCPRDVRSASSLEEAASCQDVVVTMLPDGDALRTVSGTVVPVMTRNTTLLDCSTVDIASAAEVADICSESDLQFVDAPVSGGVGGATQGTLTFMVGGTEGAYNRVLPLLEVMGARIVHCGEAGSGQAAKICNNMILGATMIVTCEAFGLADRLGLDRRKLFEVVSESSGYSWSMNAYCPAPSVGPTSPADNDYRPGFASDLMLKDLLLSQVAASEKGAETPIGTTATEVYRDFVEVGGGSGLDFSAIMQRFSRTRD